jgi:hypothetical protein
MYQTGYKGISALANGLSFDGGFCKWYYTPRENLNGFPVIDPTKQWLLNEPALLEGKTWYGPIVVPDDELGFEEITNRSKPGIAYKQKIYGVRSRAIAAATTINQENLPWYEFVLVGKQRAGGMWLILVPINWACNTMQILRMAREQ